MNKNRLDMDAQGWVRDYSEKHGFSIDLDEQEDHVAEKFKPIRKWWSVATQILIAGLVVAYVVYEAAII